LIAKKSEIMQKIAGELTQLFQKYPANFEGENNYTEN